MNINEWKTTLRWKKIPTFSEIHKLEQQDFKACYYIPDNVKEVLTIIKNSLCEGYGVANKRIIGEPGSGKTTFIYYIKKVLGTDGQAFKDFSFHILHINRLQGPEQVHELIEKRTLKLLGDYFEENNLDPEYHMLLKEETLRKEQINRLEDFILREKARFKKRLIVLVDDIDETDEGDVEKALRYLYGLLECHHICKWLIVRTTTLDHYKADFLTFIETKFAQPIRFPRVDLHGIINTRIKAANQEGLNPFIRDICARLLETFNFDLRQAVAAVPSFLEQVEPLQGDSYSDSYIGQYLNKNFTRVMTGSHIFPNIYRNSQLRYLPLEKDVFVVIALYNEFPKEYMSKLASYYREAYLNHGKGRYAKEAYVINFDMRHIKAVIDYLIDQRLVKASGSDPLDCRLTYRGGSFVKFVSERLYTEYCHQECDEDRVEKHPMFWVLAKRLLNV